MKKSISSCLQGGTAGLRGPAVCVSRGAGSGKSFLADFQKNMNYDPNHTIFDEYSNQRSSNMPLNAFCLFFDMIFLLNIELNLVRNRGAGSGKQEKAIFQGDFDENAGCGVRKIRF